MVANVVDDGEALLARGLTKSPPELLEPQDARPGGAKHHHRIDVGEVDAFVEHVDSKYDVELAR